MLSERDVSVAANAVTFQLVILLSRITPLINNSEVHAPFPLAVRPVACSRLEQGKTPGITGKPSLPHGLGHETGYPAVFRGFPQSVQTKAKVGDQISFL